MHPKWPKYWPSEGQPANLPAGLRVGRLLGGFGLAYDWLYNGLTPEERKRLVDGLHRQGIEPFLKTVKQGNWQVAVLDNFMPVIVGGAGIAAMALGEDHPDSQYIIDLARRRDAAPLSMWGPEGEWNESVLLTLRILFSCGEFVPLSERRAVRPPGGLPVASRSGVLSLTKGAAAGLRLLPVPVVPPGTSSPPAGALAQA